MTRLEVLNRIQEIYSKLENNSLEPNEIEELVDLSNNLYERALILRYKVAEQKIFGENDDLNTAEIAQKADEVSVEMPKEILTPPTIDFSIFEEKEPLLETEKIELSTETIPPKIEEKPTPEFVFETEVVQETAPEPVAEETKEVTIPVFEEIEKPKVEEKAIPTEINQNSWSAYFEKTISIHSSGIQTTLASLAGSFGLNERILYINELFNGEAEGFSDAIIEMDKISDWQTCKTVLGRLGNQQGWEKENETVGEFVLHVRRKYA